jgi:protein-S-isoprenylcysteine O-methyltransferase Ste14
MAAAGPGRVMPTTYLFAAIVAIVVAHRALPLWRFLPHPWRYGGFALVVLGVVLNLVADRAFQRAGTTVRPGEESAALVTTGAFRLSRNPMYLGFVLILGGIALLLGSLSPWAVVAAFAVAMDRLFIRDEERALEQRFGAAWLDYRMGVRRWV